LRVKAPPFTSQWAVRPLDLLDRWCLSHLARMLRGAPLRIRLWNGASVATSDGPPVATVIIPPRAGAPPGGPPAAGGGRRGARPARRVAPPVATVIIHDRTTLVRLLTNT